MRKKYTYFRPRIRSRHPSHNVLRGDTLKLLPFRSMIRLGSTTPSRRNRVEINSIEAVMTSSSKKKMKLAFSEGGVKTALWYYFKNGKLFDHLNNKYIESKDLPFPVVVKKHYGSRNEGNFKIDSLEVFNRFIKACNGTSDFLIEKFYNFSKEYRLHVTEEGCFYTCRKMMKKDTPDDQRWYKNSDNSVWILESNENFDKPDNWETIEKECVKALKSVGLDVGAVDLRTQKSKENPDFIIIEINSAPSFGEKTAEKYIEELPKILKRKKAKLDENFVQSN